MIKSTIILDPTFSNLISWLQPCPKSGVSPQMLSGYFPKLVYPHLVNFVCLDMFPETPFYRLLDRPLKQMFTPKILDQICEKPQLICLCFVSLKKHCVYIHRWGRVFTTYQSAYFPLISILTNFVAVWHLEPLISTQN